MSNSLGRLHRSGRLRHFKLKAATRNQLGSCGKPLPGSSINKQLCFVLGFSKQGPKPLRLQNGARIELFQGDESPGIPARNGFGRNAVSRGTTRAASQLITGFYPMPEYKQNENVARRNAVSALWSNNRFLEFQYE